MAIGKKTGGRNFKKGQSGNPSGGIKLPPEITAARKINTANYIEIINRLSGLSIAQLEKIRHEKANNCLEACVAAAILYTWAKGDPARLEVLMNRAIGKVADKIDASGLAPISIIYVPAKRKDKECKPK